MLSPHSPPADWPQAPAALVMVRPHRFSVNQETMADNAFQSRRADLAEAELAERAFREVSRAAEVLREAGVEVHLFDDASGYSPDSVFPNNWFSTHGDGSLVLYPMYAPARRRERRQDVVEALGARYGLRRLVDYSGEEARARFLEGTGSMVIDHPRRIAYAARSRRTDAALLQRFGAEQGYAIELFDASDRSGVPIYHTNVMMSIAGRYAIIAASLIRDAAQRARVSGRLAEGREALIEISEEQVARYCGNVLEVSTASGPRLVMSRTAHDGFSADQRALIESFGGCIVLDIPSIELSGGSARCMLAGVHLPARSG